MQVRIPIWRPFLPASSRFVGINSNLVKPGETHGLNRRLAEVVSGHQGPMTVISDIETSEPTLQEVLGAYRLTARDCETIITNIQQVGHRFCRAIRQN